MHRVSKVKDINKLAQLVQNPYSKLELFNFFSKDDLDLKWIPKRSKKTKSDDSDYNKKFNNFNKYF